MITFDVNKNVYSTILNIQRYVDLYIEQNYNWIKTMKLIYINIKKILNKY